MKVERVTSSRGKPLLVIEGAKYFLSYKGKNGSKSWRCSFPHCLAKVRTFGLIDEIDMLKSKFEHNHIPPCAPATAFTPLLSVKNEPPETTANSDVARDDVFETNFTGSGLNYSEPEVVTFHLKDDDSDDDESDTKTVILTPSPPATLTSDVLIPSMKRKHEPFKITVGKVPRCDIDEKSPRVHVFENQEECSDTSTIRVSDACTHCQRIIIELF